MAIGDSTGAVKVPHSTKFDPEVVKKELGVGISAWDAFIYRMKALSERRVTAGEAEAFATRTFALPAYSETSAKAASDAVLALFHGKAIGASLESANDTAFGLLNAVTEYIDHTRRARSPSNRLDNAWFGQGAAIKQKALDAALQLVA